MHLNIYQILALIQKNLNLIPNTTSGSQVKDEVTYKHSDKDIWLSTCDSYPTVKSSNVQIAKLRSVTD